MKKIGLGFLGVFATSAIYYFTIGSAQINAVIKDELHQQLTILEKHGFKIDNKSEQKQTEHFEIVFDKSIKMMPYFMAHGMQTNLKQLKLLRGLSIGVDVRYSSSLSQSVALDLYPMKLPSHLLSEKKNVKIKELVKQLQPMLDNKVFLVSVAFNKLGSKFKGYVKNINESLLLDTKNVTIITNTTTFLGTLKGEELESIKENIQSFQLTINDEADFLVKNFTASFEQTGKTFYDSSTSYGVETIDVKGTVLPTLHINETIITSKGKVKEGLFSAFLNASVKQIELIDETATTFHNIVLKTKNKNIDIETLNKFLKASNVKELNVMLKTLVSKGIEFEVPNFSVREIVFNQKSLKGFALDSKIEVKKTLSLKDLKPSPKTLLSVLNGKLSFSFSDEIFELLAQHPKATIALMFFPPIDKNGKKVYELKLQDNHLNINGKEAI